MKRKGSVWIVLGLLLIAASLLITGHNLRESKQAGDESRKIVERLDEIISAQPTEAAAQEQINLAAPKQDKSQRMQEILKEAHEEMQKTLTGINPGGLVLSFNAELMNQRIVDIVTDINKVPNRQLKERAGGKAHCPWFLRFAGSA